MADAVYTEVLEVQIDVATFQDGLRQLESAYEDFVTRVTSKGFDPATVVNAGGFSQLQSQIGDLKNVINEFDASVTQSMDDLADDFQKVQSQVAKTAQSVIDAKAQTAQASTPSVSSSDGNGPMSIGGLRRSVYRDVKEGNVGLMDMFAWMAKIRVMWGAIGIAINAALELIKSPFTILQQGFEYLSQVQDRAAQLQGPIAENVKFASDLATNFQIAGEAATQAEQALEAMAVATKLPLDSLTRTFETVLQSGVMHYVTNLQGALNVTKELSIAMSAFGSSTDTSRKLLSEIPQLLEGQVTPSSRILQVLHMTTQEWQNMRAEAQKNGDLDVLLADKLAPYLSVVNAANLRMTALVNLIKMQASQIEGAIALPLWNQWIAILREVSGYLKEHSGNLAAEGQSVEGLVADFFKMVGAVLSLLNPFQTLGQLFHALNVAVQDTVFVLRALLDTTTSGLQQIGTFLSQIFSGKIFSASAWKETFSEIEKEGDDWVNHLEDAAVDAANATGKAFQTSIAGNNLLNKSVSPNSPLNDPNAQKEAKAAFQQLQQSFRDELQKTKDAYQVATDSIKNAEQTGLISYKDATTQRIQAISTELTAINNLINKYTQLAKSSNAPAGSVNKFVQQLDQIGQKSATTGLVGIDNTAASEEKQDEELAQKHYQAMLNLEKQHAQAMLAIYKQEAADGLHTKLEEYNQEQATANQEHQIIVAQLNAELSAAGNNAQQQQVIKDKLAAEDQRYTDETRDSSTIRYEIGAKEAQGIEQQTNKQLVLKSQIAKINDQLTSKSSEMANQITQDETKVTFAQLLAAQSAEIEAKQNLDDAKAMGVKGEALAQLQTAYAEAQKNTAQAKLADTEANMQSTVPQVLQQIFGKGVTDLKSAFETFDKTTNTFSLDFGRSVESLANATKTFIQGAASVISAIQSGYSSGGVAGAIGGGLSSISGFVPGVAGTVLSAAGTFFSFIGGLFTAAAKKIADDIQKEVSNLMEKYSTGQATLVSTLNSLEQERTSAIQQLSGKKGGQKELDQLLPQLDQQIDSLKQQQKQTITSFENQLSVLQQSSSVLGNFLQTWQQINQQVTDYINAGGDAAKAQQFLSLSLQQQLQSTIANYQSAQLSAINDALQLNSLLQQRVDLAKQYAEQEFALRNADALERAASPAVDNAIAYQQQKAQDDQQLSSLDQQISYEQQRVDLEKQVFDLASSTAALTAQSNEINIQQLQQQIQQWQDMAKIIQGIYQTNGGYALNANLFNPASSSGTSSSSGAVNIGTLQVTVNGNADASEVATSIYNELRLQGRYGVNTSYA